MIFAFILLLAVALSIFISPLIAIIVFVLGAVVFLLMFGMSSSGGPEGAGSDPGSHAARRFRREGRNTPTR